MVIIRNAYTLVRPQERDPNAPPPRGPDLLSDIRSFLRRYHMPQSRFGTLAARDHRLVEQLNNGRTLRPATEAKIRAFMEGYAG